jgi:hypothetical protein
MAIIDLDELQSSREKIGFKLMGREHVIPEMSYALSLKLEDIRKRTVKAGKDEDYEGLMGGTIETIMNVVPDMKEEDLRNNVPVNLLRKIVALINESFMSEEEEKEVDKELAHYRKKYEDEYRKKGPKTREKRKRL